MNASFEEQNVSQSSKPLQNIRTIEQSLTVLKQKLAQMNKRQCQNAQQIQKVFYSSIPNLKNKLYQTIECQKVQEKKKILFNQSVLRQKKQINLQRKLINEKEIQRNKELMNMMKINEHNKIKEKSRKNQILIEKMKNIRIQQNKRKKEMIRSSLQQSRYKIHDFHTTKMEQLRRQKEEQSLMMRKKMNKMQTELEYLGDKENETFERLDKSEQALKQLRFAVDRMQKMNENQFIKLKSKIHGENPQITEERLIEKMLLAIVESEKAPKTTFQTRKIYHSKWPSQHFANVHRG